MAQQTLAIIKPDAIERDLMGEILKRIEATNLRVRALKMVHMDKEQAKGFYAVHSDKPFFDSLTDYMSSGPAAVAVLEAENAVNAYRNLMGATKPEEAEAGTIRKEFALDIEKNSVHGSDSPENAEREINYFFNQLEIVN
ncbi:MAG: nucleoside-diphosphate kinase [Desulfohalobiaceae bacterium]